VRTAPSEAITRGNGRDDIRSANRSKRPPREEFDEAGAELSRALDHFGVPEREKQELLAAVVAHKGEVANPSC